MADVNPSKLIMRLLQELAEGEAVARGNRASAMEALDLVQKCLILIWTL